MKKYNVPNYGPASFIRTIQPTFRRTKHHNHEPNEIDENNKNECKKSDISISIYI